MMKKLNPGQTILIYIICILLFSFPLSFASGQEVTAILHGGNLTLDRNSKVSQEEVTGKLFSYGLSLFGSYDLDEHLSLQAGILYDPILRYTTLTLFEYNHSYFTLGVGPFFGFLNSTEQIMKSGISSSVRVEMPGKIFASLRSDSSIAARLVTKGDYMQERSIITIGYYVPNAICSINLISKNFTKKETSSLITNDSLTKYSFDVEIFQKNIPLNTLLSFGYEKTARTYEKENDPPATDSINSLILGTRFTYQISNHMKLFFDLESSVYSFPVSDGNMTISREFPRSYLFRIDFGLSLDLSKITKTQVGDWND